MKEGWEYKKLGEVCKSDLGKTLNQSKDTGDLYPYLCAVNILWDKIDLSTLKQTRFEKTELERYSVRKGDLLVCEGGDIGRAAIWDRDEIIQYQNALHRIRFNGEILPRFCLLYLRNLKQKGILDHKYGKGVTILHLVKSSLLSIPIPIPSTSEQQQIVSELDLLSGVIEKQKAQLEELDKLAQSIFYDMFGDPVTNEKGWEMKKLFEISNVGTGSTPSRNNDKYYEEGTIPWVKTTEVQNCDIFDTEEKITEFAIKETNCKVYPIGTLLMAMYGQGKTRGQLAKLRIEAATNQACAAIVLNNDFSNPYYIYEYLHLQYENIRDMARGGNQLNLNLNIVKAIPIYLPPLSLQQEFAVKVEAIEAMKAKVRQSLKEAETLFNERMDYYFN